MPEAKRAAVYCRISNDSESRELGVTRQEEDCRALADRLGLTVARVHIENDISASTASRKPRPEYQEMLRSVRSREVDVILAYSFSRLTRRLREFLDLIDLYQATGVTIRTCVSGDPDLSTADGRGMAINLANWDQIEAERIAERVRRAKRQTAEAGGWRGGPRPFGFLADGVTIRDDEAAVIRYTTTAILSGRSLAAVVREINGAGSRSSFGNEWSRHSLRDMLLRPRNCGLIHTGRVRKDEIKIVGQAGWGPIISREEFDALSRLLLDPLRRTHDNSTTKWIGSSIYRCGRPTEDGGACGSVMRSFSVQRAGRNQAAYKCADYDHLSITAVPTDNFVRHAVAALVRDPGVIEVMRAGELDTARADRERRKVLALRLEQTEADYDADLIDARRYRAKADRLTAEIGEIDQRLADAAQQNATLPVFNAIDPGSAFMESPLDVQRAVLRLVMNVEVRPQTNRGVAWSADRLRLSSIGA